MLDQAALQIQRERESSQPNTPLRRLPELLRQAIASLMLALGFAALAQRPGIDRSLLQEMRWRWQRKQASFKGDRGRRISGAGSYLRELGRRDGKR